ncbi:MAG: phosphate ABC transporter substrate-binding protein [Bacteroidia bacterium]|nr:phosphate ABC transporter substrate-binding protein [Bacteroidia bacterium]MDW8302630.1 phosphate ABC transporter substrate-binding protein [Bacteroidia bacterium]
MLKVLSLLFFILLSTPSWVLLGQEKTLITMKGSDMLKDDVMPALIEAYKKKNPNVEFEVKGGGTAAGISALFRRTVDVCLATRPLRESETKHLHDVVPTEIPILIACMAIFVNKDNPVNELSLYDITRIYSGEAKSWKEFGGKDIPIVAYTLDPSYGTYTYFIEEVMGGVPFGPNVIPLKNSYQMIDSTIKYPGGIGFGTEFYTRGKNIKVVKVRKPNEYRSYLPTPMNGLTGKYPITRKFRFITLERPTGVLKDFIDFTLSPEGQKIIEEQKYFKVEFE